MTPSETQVPLINWKQDINDTDAEKGDLASAQSQNLSSESGSIGTTINACNMTAIMQQNYNLIMQNQNSSIQTHINNAINDTSDSKINVTLQNMQQYGYQDYLQKTSVSKGLDPLLMLAIIVTESTGDPNAGSSVGAMGLMQVMVSSTLAAALNTPNAATVGIDAGTSVYVGKCNNIGTTNPVCVCLAYNSWISGLEAASAGALDGNLNDWTWVAMAPAMMTAGGVTEQIEYFPKVCIAYEKLSKKSMFSSLDSSTLHFPVAQADLATTTFATDYSSPNVNSTDSTVTINNSIGLTTKAGTNICACADGTVVSTTADSVTVAYTNGIQTTVTGLQKVSVSANQLIQSSMALGTSSTAVTLAVTQDGVYKDPKAYFQSLDGKLGKALA